MSPFRRRAALFHVDPGLLEFVLHGRVALCQLFDRQLLGLVVGQAVLVLGFRQVILHLLQTALSRIESSGSLLIHISPDDYDMITDAKEQLMQNVVSPDTVLELVEDPTLKENECIIETDGGIFDCSVGVELEELGRKIKLLSFDRRK